MAKDYELVITVNFPDDTEREIGAAAHSEFAKLGEMVEFALKSNGINDGDWSSLVVTIVGPQVAAPKRPALRVV